MNEKMIEEMVSCMCSSYKSKKGCKTCPTNWCYADECATMAFCKGYRKIPEGSVVLTKEEYEKLKSLYDCGDAYMTSQIGDLPLTIEGLRKSVDEITRLNRVEAELQELNAKYYNEAKDLRRKLKEAQEFWKASYRTEQQARKETAEKFAEKLENGIDNLDIILHEDNDEQYVSINQLLKFIDEIAKQYGVEE